MEDIQLMIAALNAMKDVLNQGKSYDSLSGAAREILNANIAELSDIIVRYCKENYI
jgi:hypothetical protein